MIGNRRSGFAADENWLRKQIEPYGLKVGNREASQLLTYFELLMQWNQHINLVSAAAPEVWARRHFAESLYLSRWVELEGRLLDVGSGAGFPALPLKISFPGLAVTLLEPIAKKRAFLKEVVRACELQEVQVLADRVEEYDPGAGSFSVVTSRALGHFRETIAQVCRYLQDGGMIFMWTTARQRPELESASELVAWQEPIDIPGTRESQIWRGWRKTTASAGC